MLIETLQFNGTLHSADHYTPQPPSFTIALLARLGILTVVLLKIHIFCDVTACKLVIFPDVSHDHRKIFLKSRHENRSDFGTAFSNILRQKTTAIN